MDTKNATSGRHHHLPATTEATHTGYYDNSLPPVLRIDSGDIVTTETLMLMDGRLAPGMSLDEVLAIRKPLHGHGRSGHTLTGPIYVEGAEPGDTLEVRILKVRPYDFGVHYVLPGSMGAGTLPEDFPDGHVLTYRWSEDDPTIRFAPGIEFPVQPFLGVMAVAPAQPGEVSTTAPGPHGGNMDLKDLGEGATLYLPVFVPGALFSVGDAHAAQGDGEVSGTALETGMKELVLQFTVRKDLHLKRPLVETPTHWIAMGFHEDLDEAAKMALRDAVEWVSTHYGLSPLEAYSLCCMVVDMRVTQLVDHDKGIHAMIPKGVFGR